MKSLLKRLKNLWQLSSYELLPNGFEIVKKNISPIKKAEIISLKKPDDFAN